VVQPSSKKDGSPFTVLSLLGMIEVRRKPYVMIMQESIGDGFLVRCTAVRRAEIVESCRQAFFSVRSQLKRLAFDSCSSSTMGDSESEAESACSSLRSQGRVTRRVHATERGHRRDSILAILEGVMPKFAFFRERLQEHCILSNGGRTASRREMSELPTGCLVFSDRPVQLDAGCFHFALRVDEVVPSFEGLPLLGFTRRVPRNDGGLHPQVSNCLGASVLVGTGGKAYARDAYHHFKVGFKPPPPHEVETWSLPPGSSAASLPKLSAGDVVGCMYTLDGRIKFWLNEEKILDFDTGRPIQDAAHYYAVVDVCFTAGVLTLMPSQVLSRQDFVTDARHAQGGSAACVYDNCMPGSLLTDVRAPLATVMSVGDLGTIDLDLTNMSSASSSVSVSSLPSMDSNQLEPPERSSTLEAAAEVQVPLGATLAEPLRTSGIAYFWASETHTSEVLEENMERPAPRKLDSMEGDVELHALEGQKIMDVKHPAADDEFHAPEKLSANEAGPSEQGHMSHRTRCPGDVSDPAHMSFRPPIVVGAVMCTLVVAFLFQRSPRLRR